MQTLSSNGYEIAFEEQGYIALNQFIATLKPTKIVLLTDENTRDFCRNVFLHRFPTNYKMIFISIPCGEEHKNIDTCIDVWQSFAENQIDRKSLIINLGGGVVTDLGGFVAATYLRGIDYINIPTSLLAMVDASIGGKTGIDFGLIKNQIGLTVNPKLVIIDPLYLKTLPQNEFHSGIAEILKHGLIHSETYWQSAIKIPLTTNSQIESLIFDSITIKKGIVEKDPTEQGLRKSLNFGHTLGHAIETYSLSGTSIRPLLHGEAVAIGLIMETYISVSLFNFPMEKLQELIAVYFVYYTKVDFNKIAIEKINTLMKSDKKNLNGRINFVLLKKIGIPMFDCEVSPELITEAFDFYNNLKK